MPVDDAIPLAAGNIGADNSNQLMSMFQLASQVNQYRRQNAAQNALVQTFSDPNSVDPTTGMPTPQAIRKIIQVDPQMGMKLQDDAMQAQVRRAQQIHYQTETGKLNFDFMSKAAGIGYDAYDQAKKDGRSEQDAIAAGQAARNEAVKGNGGVISNETADGVLSKPFDPRGAFALASSNQEWSNARHQRTQEAHQTVTEDQTNRRLDLADKRADEQARRDSAMIAATNRREEEGGWQVLTDPKNNTQYRYNPRSGKATSLDGSQPYEPGGAAKIGGGSAPRSAASAYIQKFMQDNPTATADDISKAASKFRLGQSEAGTIGTRAGAADVAAKDVQIFAKQARDASNALGRTDYALANEVLQNWDMKTENPKLRQLMIAADALVNSRARAISPTGSPHVNDQLEGRKMLAAAFSKGDFEAAVQQMEKEASGVFEATRQTKEQFNNEGKSALPDAARSKLKKGVTTTFGNGQTWTLDDSGNPKQVK